MGEHVINTASGGTLDLDDPRASQIVLDDVAGGLSHICRFGAQASRFHSVAQHAVLVSQLVAEAGHPDLTFAALHHDSHEAYVCDLPSPLKRKFASHGERVYATVCEALDAAIATALRLPDLSDAAAKEIKKADHKALMIEAAALLPDGGRAIGESLGLQLESPDRLDDSLPSEGARDLFLVMHRRLAG